MVFMSGVLKKENLSFGLWGESAPEPLKNLTLSFCTGDDLLRFACVSKKIAQLVSQDAVWINFARKKGIHLAVMGESSAKKKVIEYVKTFTSLFPELKLKENSPPACFEDRWHAIGSFASMNTAMLLEKLKTHLENKEALALLEASPANTQFIKAFMEKGLDDWKFYVKRGFPSSNEEMMSILDLVPKKRYNLEEEYFCCQLVKEIRIVKGEKFQFPDAAIKVALEKHFTGSALLMINKQKAMPDLFQHALDHFSNKDFHKICRHFLSLGYEFSKENLREFLTKRWFGENYIGDEKFNEMFDQILKTVKFETTSSDIEWAANPASYTFYSYLCPKVLQKVVDLSQEMPTTKLFQYCVAHYFAPRIVDMFLKKGYQISSSDFRFVIDKLVEQKKEKKLPWLHDDSEPDTDVLTQMISQKEIQFRVGHSGKKYCVCGGLFKPSKDDFHYMLEKRPNKFMIQEIFKNGYQADSEDFRKGIDHLDFLQMRDFLKGDAFRNYSEDAYMPTQEDFHYALKKKASWSTIVEIISRGYRVTSEDFLLALEYGCVKTIDVLMNDGYVIQEEYESQIEVFAHENGGFEPSEIEYERALKLGCGREILDLMITRNKKLRSKIQ